MKCARSIRLLLVLHVIDFIFENNAIYVTRFVDCRECEFAFTRCRDFTLRDETLNGDMSEDEHGGK